jgi:hypothetical protein
MSFTIEFFASFLRIGMTVLEVHVHRPLTEEQVQSMIEIIRTDLLVPANSNPEDFDRFPAKEAMQDLFGEAATVNYNKIRRGDMIHFIGSDTQEVVIRVHGETFPFEEIAEPFLEAGIIQKNETAEEVKKSPNMPHIHFCQNESCDQSSSKKCAGCYSTWYCTTECQQADWPNHRTECKEIQQDRLALKLYTQIATSMGKSLATYPYDEFKQFYKSRPAAKDRTTLNDWMEDWLEGWYTYDRERKQLLRSVFLAKGLVWSSDVYPFYNEWSKNRSGNRYEKIAVFVKETGFLF